VHYKPDLPAILLCVFGLPVALSAATDCAAASVRGGQPVVADLRLTVARGGAATRQACIADKVPAFSVNSDQRALRIIKILRILKIIRLIKAVKVVEYVLLNCLRRAGGRVGGNSLID
jgi:hypothetical protein